MHNWYNSAKRKISRKTQRNVELLTAL